MSVFQPPPTYALPILVDPDTGKSIFNPIWLSWFLEFAQNTSAAGSGSVTSINASGGTTGLTFSGGPVTTAGTLTISGTLAPANGGTGITSLGTGVATFLGTPSSANLLSALTTKTGTGNAVFSDSPIFTTQISTPSIVTASGALGITPAAGSGLNVNLSTTGDFAVNTNQLYVDTSTGNVGFGVVPTKHIDADVFHVDAVNHAVQINSTATSYDLNVGSGGVNTVGIFISNRTASTSYALNSTGSNYGLIQNNAGDIWSLGTGAIPTILGTNILVWTKAGKVMIGSSTSEITLGNNSNLQVNGASAATNSAGISAWSADALGARLELGKSRGAAIGTNTIVNSGDVVGSITGYGANGSTFTNAAQISMEIDGTPGATNDMPGRIVFKTTPDGSGTLTEAMRLSQDQTALFASSIKTAAPTTGTAAFWKLGSLITGQVGLALNTTQYVELDIGGTFIKLATV